MVQDQGLGKLAFLEAEDLTLNPGSKNLSCTSSASFLLCETAAGSGVLKFVAVG